MEFLTRIWAREHGYALQRKLWVWNDNRIAVQFEGEWHDHTAQWWRNNGNEMWEFDDNGLVRRREASVTEAPSSRADRRILSRRDDIAVR